MEQKVEFDLDACRAEVQAEMEAYYSRQTINHLAVVDKFIDGGIGYLIGEPNSRSERFDTILADAEAGLCKLGSIGVGALNAALKVLQRNHPELIDPIRKENLKHLFGCF